MIPRKKDVAVGAAVAVVEKASATPREHHTNIATLGVVAAAGGVSAGVKGVLSARSLLILYSYLEPPRGGGWRNN